jgi:hypothetical protein
VAVVKNLFFCYNILMSSDQTNTSEKRFQYRWHAMPHGQRVAILGSMALSLLGILSTMAFAGATNTADTTVQFQVTGSGGFAINIIALPEKRVPATYNNGTIVTLEVRNPSSSTPLVSQDVTTGSGGTLSGVVIVLSPGTYDITAKGYSHLRTKKSSQSLSNGVTIDFTSGGASPLLSGDVNGANGDNKVNGIDLSQIVSGLTSYNVRYDLNRDSRVNGIDLTNAVSNLNVTGAS